MTDEGRPMNLADREPRYLFFESFRLDCRTGELRRSGRKVRLQAQPTKLLLHLATRPGELVTRAEIEKALWGDDTFVDFEQGINFSIKQIRDALGDSAEKPRYVETVPREGYRFIAPTADGAGAERELDSSPYPGLLSFTSVDAEFFFGREEEVQILWSKLERRRLLALIGPSGAGKSSLLQAGLLPWGPQGWGMLIVRLRGSPFPELARALRAEISSDEEAAGSSDIESVLALLRQWRAVHTKVCLAIDAFEELFTLNDEGTRVGFSELIGKAAESGIHVLLAMRDDFFVHCRDYPGLEPVFTEVTPLKPPRGLALRRALVEPARKRGYRFEDDALAGEILAELTSERGALPLLAFAAARLWEKRDRSRCLLTRQAYLEIGGVSGALAKHAEETLSAIGPKREPVVREIFRNLTTAKGTRAAQDREELLSVHEDRDGAGEILRKLIDARLLTSAEREVEVVHESLLSAWPRLVRWQAQDAEGAVFRDQLRQAARAWQERGRPDDLLWTGTAYRELALWRERYPGGLTATERGFVDASTRLAGRRRRRRQFALTSLVAAAIVVAALTSSLWRLADTQALRAEAAQLLALGRLELEYHPSAALAFALASLERTDTPEARRFAVEALWHGAAAIFLSENVNVADFSLDGKWLATAGVQSGVLLWSIEGGGPKTLGEPRGANSVQFGPGSDFLANGGEGVRFWSVPEGTEVRSDELGGVTLFRRRASHLFSFTTTSSGRRAVRDWSDPEGSSSVSFLDFTGFDAYDVDASGEWLLSGRGKGVYLSPLRDSRAKPRLLGEHGANVVRIASHPTAARVVSGDENGELRIWSFSEASGRLERTFRAPAPHARLDPTDSWMVVAPLGSVATGEVAYVVDLKGPADAEPRALRDGNSTFLNSITVHPEGLWLVTANANQGILWPLQQKHSRVLRGQPPPKIQIAFTPDGNGLVSTSEYGPVRLWPLSSRGEPGGRILMQDKTAMLSGLMDVDPSGGHVLVGSQFLPGVFLLPLQGGQRRAMPGFTRGKGWALSVAFSPDGKRAAAAGMYPPILRIWNLESGELRELDLNVPDETCASKKDFDGSVLDLEFLAHGRILTTGQWGHMRVWDLEQETAERIRPCGNSQTQSFLALNDDRQRVLVVDRHETTRISTLSLLHPETGTFQEITTHGNRVWAAALDPTGTRVATGDLDGVVRVGPSTGEAPHLLFGHKGEISDIAVAPDGKWIASAGQDGTIRLWPMPSSGEVAPFNTLSYEEILERIRGLTNLRVVSDPTSATGHRVEIGPFPGWKGVPAW
jgi:WD40 repeat protein/DNA-binding winged helix-turn-helix (wHTH) protein